MRQLAGTGKLPLTAMAAAGMRRNFSIRPLAFFIFAVLVASAALDSHAVFAQAGPVKGSLSLLRQSDWTTDSPFEMALAVQTTADPAELDIVVTVYGALRSRSQFQQSLEGRLPSTSLVLERQTLADITQPNGNTVVSLPVHDPTDRRFHLRDGGVYPVRVDLRRSRSGEVLDRFTTHIVRITDPTVAQELAVTTVLPVAAPVGRLDHSSLDLPDNGASVAAVIDAVADSPQTPLTMLVSPETVERLAENEEVAGLVPALDALPQTAAVPMTTWAPVHRALFDEKLAGELSLQFQRAENQLAAISEARVAQTWFATQPLDPRALTALMTRGYERLIVPESALVAVRRNTTLARPFVVSPGKGQSAMPALQADIGLANHFTNTSEPVLAAHHLLADLAVLYNDRPALERSVVVMPPENWRPDATFLSTYLDALTSAPMLEPVTIDEAFAVPPELSGRSPLVRQFASAQGAAFDDEEVLATRDRIDGFATMVFEDNPWPSELSRTLLQSERGDLSLVERQVLRDRATETINQQLTLIDVPPERSLRLTARTGEIPVSVQNETGYPIKVRLRLTSEKLLFGEGDSRNLEIERSRITERFAIETRTTGAFPVEVLVESPDGALLVDRSRVTVRSTAASGVGIALSAGAGMFLLLWWARSLIISRRTKRAESTT